MIFSLMEGGVRKGWGCFVIEERAKCIKQTSKRHYQYQVHANLKEEQGMDAFSWLGHLLLSCSYLLVQDIKMTGKPSWTSTGSWCQSHHDQRGTKKKRAFFPPLIYLTGNIYVYNSLLSVRPPKRSNGLYSHLNTGRTGVFNIHLPQAPPLPIVLHPLVSHPHHKCMILALSLLDFDLQALE